MGAEKRVVLALGPQLLTHRGLARQIPPQPIELVLASLLAQKLQHGAPHEYAAGLHLNLVGYATEDLRWRLLTDFILTVDAAADHGGGKRVHRDAGQGLEYLGGEGLHLSLTGGGTLRQNLRKVLGEPRRVLGQKGLADGA